MTEHLTQVVEMSAAASMVVIIPCALAREVVSGALRLNLIECQRGSVTSDYRGKNGGGCWYLLGSKLPQEALHASECSELHDLTGASCWIFTQR